MSPVVPSDAIRRLGLIRGRPIGRVAAERADDHPGAVMRHVCIPQAGSIDDPLGNAVAVDVTEHGNVARQAAELVDAVRHTVAMRAREPRAVAIDDEIDVAVTVDIAQQRHVAGYAAEDVSHIRHAIPVEVDGPDAGTVAHHVGNSISVHVGNENLFGRRREQEGPVHHVAQVEIEEELPRLWPIHAEVERKPRVRQPRAEDRGREGEQGRNGPAAEGQGCCAIDGLKGACDFLTSGWRLLIGRRRQLCHWSRPPRGSSAAAMSAR